jgi:hypothetical protein
MTTESKPLTPEMEKLRRDIAAARAGIAKYKMEHPGEPFPFAKLKGIWKGKVHFTDADIEAARIKARDLPE